ncbi:hypothetical protein STEG23_019510 [Scotinomys teguina]
MDRGVPNKEGNRQHGRKENARRNIPEVCEELYWDFDGDFIESVDCFWYVPCIPDLSKTFVMKIFQVYEVQVFEL